MAKPDTPALALWRANFPLRFAFRHNLAERKTATTAIAAVTIQGTVGWGQALPREYLTGETLDSVIADASTMFASQIAPLPWGNATTVPDALALLRPAYLQADAVRRTAAFALVEMAALDAWSRHRRLPLRLPGPAASSPVPLVGVIPALGPRKACWLARILRWLGYRRFKVKVGADAAADALRLAAVRSAIGPKAWLAVDANQAWSPDEAIRRAPGLRRFGVALIEEPLHSGATKCNWQTLESRLGIPMMADESLCTLDDARRPLDYASPSWWNLRFGKNGGFSGLAELSALAEENGITVYGGVLVGETSQLAAAGRAALAGVTVTCLEYGFPRVFLNGDPFRGGPGGFSGRVAPLPERPGMGATLRADILTARGKLLTSVPKNG